MEQQIFMEALENLKIFAKSNDNTVSKNDILDCLGHDIQLDEEKWQMIAGYLKFNNITVSDINLTQDNFGKMMEEADKKAADDKASKSLDTGVDMQEKQLLAMYLEDLKAVTPLSRATQAVILQDVCDKDEESRMVIINNYFLQVVEWVKPFAGRGVPVMDMIQESNLIVMDELGGRKWMKELDAFDVMDSGNMDDWSNLSQRLDNYLIDRIGKNLERMIEAQTGERMVGNRVLLKVNEVNDAAQQAFKEYGRKVSVEELAEYMHVPDDDIREALRLSGNRIENVIVPD